MHLGGRNNHNIDSNMNEISFDKRIARASATPVGALLKTARIVTSSSFYRLYVKPGGHRQAMKDLRSLKPLKIEKSDSDGSSLAEFGSGFGKRYVKVEEIQGQTSMTIRREFKGKHGHTDVVTEKIKYF